MGRMVEPNFGVSWYLSERHIYNLEGLDIPRTAVVNIITVLFEPRLISCRMKIFLLIDFFQTFDIKQNELKCQVFGGHTAI